MGSKSFGKPGSFPVKRSSSMEAPRRFDANSRTLVPKKPFSSNFPTSQHQTLLEEGIHHYSHPQHPLALLSQDDLFTCAGCKEHGSGVRLTCLQCDFQLHHFCSSPPSALKDHPLHAQHLLVFHAKSKQGVISWPRCNVCDKSTKGYTFRCKACGFQMHPCCAELSKEMSFPCHSHRLKLLPPVFTSSSASVEPGFACGQCNQKRSGRVYGCTVCDYHLHAFCAKAMINGLHDIGVNSIEKPNKNLGKTAARVASQVLMVFVDGLIEGLGEGMGQSFFSRGRSRQPNTRQIE